MAGLRDVFADLMRPSGFNVNSDMGGKLAWIHDPISGACPFSVDRPVQSAFNGGKSPLNDRPVDLRYLSGLENCDHLCLHVGVGGQDQTARRVFVEPMNRDEFRPLQLLAKQYF